MVRLNVEKLTCGYSGRPVVSNISFEASEGEMVAIIGPNGAGKTTLLRTVSRLLKPLSGRILVDDVDIWETRIREAARLVSYMPPPPPRGFNITVTEFIQAMQLPLNDWLEDVESIKKTLTRVGLDGFENRRIDELSSGELQRVLVASVLARNTPVMVLDEPTAHLDLRYQVEVLKVLREEAAARRGIVLVSLHDIRLAATFADKILLLDRGRMAAFGAPGLVLDARVLSEVYGVRIRVRIDPELGFIAVPEQE